MANKTSKANLIDARLQQKASVIGTREFDPISREEDEEERRAREQYEMYQRMNNSYVGNSNDQRAAMNAALNGGQSLYGNYTRQDQGRAAYNRYLNEINAVANEGRNSFQDQSRTLEQMRGMAQGRTNEQVKQYEDYLKSPEYQYSQAIKAHPELQGLLEDYGKAEDADFNSNKAEKLKNIQRISGWDADTVDRQVAINRKNNYGIVDYASSDAESRAKSLTQLESKIKAGRTLTDDERLVYSQAKIESTDGQTRNLLNQYIQSERYENYAANSASKEERDRYAKGNQYRSTKELRKALEEESGLSKAELDDYINAATVIGDYNAEQYAKKDFTVNENDPNKALKNARNWAGGVAEGVAGAIPNYINNKTNPENPYSRRARLSNVAEYGNEQTLQDLEDTNLGGSWLNKASNTVTGQNVAQNLYGATQAAAVSSTIGLVSGGIGSAVAEGASGSRIYALANNAEKIGTLARDTVGFAPFFASGYSSGYEDAVSRGLSQSDAIVEAYASGIAEVLTEKVSLDNIWELAKGTRAGKNIFVNALVQSGIEGAEELGSDIINSITDQVVARGTGKTKFDTRIDELLVANPNMTKDEATNIAMKQAIQEAAADAVGGFISGGISGSGAAAVGIHNANQTTKKASEVSNRYSELASDTTDATAREKYEKYANNPYQKMADEVEANTKQGSEAKAVLQEVADRQAEGKKVTISDKARVAQSREVAMAEKDYNNSVKQAMEDQVYRNVPAEYRNKDNGMTGNEAYTALRDAVKSGDTQSISDAMIDAKASNNESVIEDLKPYASSKGIDLDSVDTTTQQDAYVAGITGKELESNNTKVQEAYTAGKEARLTELSRTTVSNKSDLNSVKATARDGSEVTLTGTFRDGKLIDSNNNAHSIDSLILEDDAVSNAIREASTKQTDAERNAFLNNIEDNTNINRYSEEFAKYYKAGQANLPFKDQKGLSLISNETAKNIYEAGKATQINTLNGKAIQETNKAFGIQKGDGSYNDMRKHARNDNISVVARTFAKLSGVNINLVDGLDKKNGQAVNAFFDPETSTITIKASNAKQMFHEVGEFIEFYNEEGHEALRQGLNQAAMDILGAKAYAAWHDNYLKVYTDANDIQTQKQITNEMTNDLIVALMSTNKGREAMAKYVAENTDEATARTFGEKVKSLFYSVADAIKRIKEGNSSLQDQMRALGESELEKYADQFVDALDKAIKVYQSGEIKTAADTTKHSMLVSIEGYRAVLLNDNQMELPNGDIIPVINGRVFSTREIANNSESVRREVKAYLSTLQGKKLHIKSSNKDVTVSKSFAKEYAYAEEKKNKLRKKQKVVKLNAAIGTEKIVEDAIYDSHAPNHDTTNHPDMTRGWDYYTSKFAIFDFGNRYSLWECSLNIGMSIDGTDYLYDITKMQEIASDTSITIGAQMPASPANSNILPNKNNVKNSADITGKELSEGQQEYFKDSQMRDDQGRLKIFYHGTGAYGFDVFDIKKAKYSGLYGRGFYFADSENTANTYGKTYNVYLNIVDPLKNGTNNLTEKQIKALINELANNDDYGIENYGYGATPQSVFDAVWGRSDFAMIQDLNASCVGDMVEAVKILNKVAGTTYDGIQAEDQVIAFYSNQIKDVNNQDPTENDNIYHSMEVTEFNEMEKASKNNPAVDFTKNLVAVHNLGLEQLKGILELGGLPSPSIAIIKDGMSHEMYGDVSIIFDKATIDPRNHSKNNVYSGDAWTPVFPTVEAKISERKAEALRKRMADLLPKNIVDGLGHISLDNDNLEDQINRSSTDPVEAFARKDQFKYAYLADKGIEVVAEQREKSVTPNAKFSNEQIKAIVEVVSRDELEEFRQGGYQWSKDHPEFEEKIRKALNDQFAQKYLNKENDKKTLSLFKKGLYDEALGFSDLDYAMRGAINYLDNGITYEADPKSLRDAINAKLTDEDDYKAWLSDLFDGIVEKRGLRNNKDYFTYSGNRRSWEALHDEYNLQNIVKIMNAQDERGADAFFGESAIQALALKKFKSIDDIHNSENLLYIESEEEHDKRITEQSNRFNEIVDSIMDRSERNSFIAHGRAVDAVVDALRTSKTEAGITKVLKEYTTLNISDHTAKDILDLMKEISNNPTGYFEAKPKRAVWIDEIAGVVLPANSPAEIIDKLVDLNIPWNMYQESNYEEGDSPTPEFATRKARFEQMAQSHKFSLEVNSDGQELSEGQSKYFAKSKARDDQGRLLTLFHGTSNASFTIFNNDYAISNEGYFFTKDQWVAKTYSGTNEEFKPLYSFDELKKTIENVDSAYSVKKDGSDYVVFDGDEEIVRSNDIQDTYNEWNDYSGWGGDSAIYKVYLNITNPLIIDAHNNNWDEIEFNGEKVNTNYLSDYAKEKGYDGLIVENVIDSGLYGNTQERLSSTTDYVVFNPSQIKSIYNMSPTVADDIRHSMEVKSDFDMFMDILNEQQDQNKAETSELLRKGVECLKNIKVSDEAIKRLAKQIRTETLSNVKQSALEHDLKRVFEYMQSEEYVDYDDMVDIIQDVAGGVIDQATEKVGVQEYKDFVNTVKAYNLKLTDEQMAEVKHIFGSFTEFKKAISPLNISTKGTISLDSAWEEMAEASGYILDIDTNTADMPTVLYDTLQSMRPTVQNAYGMDAEEASRDLANRILEGYFREASNDLAKVTQNKSKEQIKQLKKEMAYRERWATAEKDRDIKQIVSELNNTVAEIKRANQVQAAQIKYDYEQRLKDVKQTEAYKKWWANELNKETIAQIKAKNREKAAQAKERRLVAELKSKVNKRAADLIKRITDPTDAKHVPDSIKEPVLQFLYALDFVEPQIKQNKDGLYYVKVLESSYIDADGKRHVDFKTLTGATEYQVLTKFKRAMAEGLGSNAQIKWQDRMAAIRDIYRDVLNGNLDNTRADLEGLKETLSEDLLAELDELLKNNTINVNQLNSKELTTVNNVLRNIIHAIAKQDELLANNAAVSETAYELTDYADSIDSRVLPPILQRMSNFFRLDMITPSTAFELMGTAGKRLYHGIREGLNTRTLDIKKAGEFIDSVKKELNIKDKEISEWSGDKAKIHEIRVADGMLRMTDAQIMALYETMKQKGMYDRIAGGIVIDTIGRGMLAPVVQNDPIHVTPAEVKAITARLSSKQKAFADALQKYLAEDCAEAGNEVTNQIYGYSQFINKEYFPLFVDKSYIKTSDNDVNTGSMIISPGFTHSRVANTVPIKILDIFDAYTSHVDEMANFHGFKAATKDIKRVLDYREVSTDKQGDRTYTNTRDAINRLLFSNKSDNGGVRYIEKLLSDIQGQTNESKRIAELVNKLAGNLKAAAVMANSRVVSQQPTAYLRALYEIDPRYLFSVNVIKAVRNVDKVAELWPSAWWKGNGYYDTAIGPSLKSMVTGQATFRDKVNNVAGYLAGKADDLTWSVLYSAVEKEQRDIHKGEGLSEEEMRKLINERADEVVDKTQVIDTVLHRSQYMRSSDSLHSLQTAFMAESTKSYNMLLLSAVQDMREGKAIPTKFLRAATAFTVTNIVNAVAQSIIDAFRYDNDDDKWDDVFKDKYLDNLADDMNPIKLIPWVKDVYEYAFRKFTGERDYGNSRYDLDGIEGMIDAAYKLIKQNDKLTTYGILKTLAKPLSQLSGLPIYNAERELETIYNSIFKDLKATITTNSDLKSSLVKRTDQGDMEAMAETVTDAMNNGQSIKDIRSWIQSTYKDAYIEAVDTYGLDSPEAEAIAQTVARGYATTEMSDEDADSIINGWLEENISYSDLDKAIKSGDRQSVARETKKLVEAGKELDNINEHVLNNFGSSVEYERKHETDTDYEDMVDEVFLTTTNQFYDEAKADYDKKQAESADKKAKEAEKAERKAKVISAVENENLSEFYTAMREIEKSSDKETEAKRQQDARDSAKDAIEKQYKNQYIQAYKSGDLTTANELKRKMVKYRVKADEKYGLKLNKGETYYDHEVNIINGWLEN